MRSPLRAGGETGDGDGGVTEETRLAILTARLAAAMSFGAPHPRFARSLVHRDWAGCGSYTDANTHEN